MLQYVQYILRGLTSVCLSVSFSWLTAKSVDLMVPCDGFLCVTVIINIFHSGYTCTLVTEVLFKKLFIRTAVLLVESSCSKTKHNEYFTFQTIIDGYGTITGECGTILIFIVATLVLFVQSLTCLLCNSLSIAVKDA